jgi:hypothetical protein
MVYYLYFVYESVCMLEKKEHKEMCMCVHCLLPSPLLWIWKLYIIYIFVNFIYILSIFLHLITLDVNILPGKQWYSILSFSYMDLHLEFLMFQLTSLDSKLTLQELKLCPQETVILEER